MNAAERPCLLHLVLALAAALLLLGGLFLSPALGLHLLMAEDNELNREIAVTLLEEQGAAITTAENGREAVRGSKPLTDPALWPPVEEAHAQVLAAIQEL